MMSFVALMANWNGLLIKALKTPKDYQINKNLRKTVRMNNFSPIVANGSQLGDAGFSVVVVQPVAFS